MKYTIDNAHREFFCSFHWIEFEELLSQSAVTEINQAIDETLGTHELTKAGLRDLWRDNARIKQLVCQRRLAEMVADLVEERPLRLAFDQAVLIEPTSASWIPAGGSLETLSAFRGVVCGLILCLKAPKKASAPFLPTREGNGICVSPAVKLDFRHIDHREAQRYLIIGYGKAVTVFVHQPDDAYAPTLRKMGYNYGDRLVDRLHPVVIR
jgi:hypothetical protein